MQTFVPLYTFEKCAQVLDRQRLGKQRLEAIQLVRTVNGETQGWRNHPAAKMWRGHVGALARYGVAMCDEWLRRGYKDTLKAQLLAYADNSPAPDWWLDERVHASHRARLIEKLPSYYTLKFPGEKPGGYFWPVK